MHIELKILNQPLPCNSLRFCPVSYDVIYHRHIIVIIIIIVIISIVPLGCDFRGAGGSRIEKF